jgi:hypothetical protein
MYARTNATLSAGPLCAFVSIIRTANVPDFFYCGTVFVVFRPLNSLIAELDMVCNAELASIMGNRCRSELCSSAAQSASRNDLL